MRRIDWASQYQKDAPILKGLCHRYVADTAIAEDLVQETFITAIEKIDTYKGSGPLEGWIRRIAINKALKYIKEHQGKQLSLENMKDTTEDQHEVNYSPNKFRRAIEQASFSVDELLHVLDDLPVHHKTVFNLYVLDGYKHHQIAEMLNISTGTSKSHLSRARKKAQELLYEYASQNSDKEPRRRGALFFLFFAPKTIDHIFQKGLKNYQLNAGDITFPTGSTSLIKAGFTIGKALVCGIIVTSVISGAIILHKEEKSEPLPTSNASLIIEHPDATTIVSSDSIKCDSIVQVTKVKEEPEIQNTKKKAPVIIRKKVIVHDTIRLPKPVSK